MNLLLSTYCLFFIPVYTWGLKLYIKWEMLNRLEISDILVEFGVQYFKCTFSKM